MKAREQVTDTIQEKHGQLYARSKKKEKEGERETYFEAFSAAKQKLWTADFNTASA